MARGRKTGGRQKGTPNKFKAEHRAILEALLNKRLPDLDAMIEDAWHGIEIEKQVQGVGPDGKPQMQVVVGRLNAMPDRAAKLLLEAYKLLHPPPVQFQGEDGGALVIQIVKAS